MIDERMRKLVTDLDQWHLCMSYNDSYFGEPEGFLKQTVRQLVKHIEADDRATIEKSIVGPTGEQLYAMVTSRFTSGSFPWSLVTESGKAAWNNAASDLVFAPDTIMSKYSGNQK